ncbi:MAG: HAD-IC family P-type ATPase [bacterium]|nr:HAD-IC family P-type ATPase [bacterium]
MQNQENRNSREIWHALNIQEIFNKLKTSPDGLNEEEVNSIRSVYGKNKLPEGKRATIFELITRQLINPFIYILAIAAIVSLAIGDSKDAIFIFLVILINTGVGTYQEYNAEKNISSLKKLMTIKTRVRRNGRESEIMAEDLVPGDVVLLESGMKVPADIRLFEVSDLEIDESLLTGESVPVKKNVSILNENTIVAERTNMAFAGSTVMKGRGTGVIVGTGLNTQIGEISKDVSESASAKPPLIVRMEKFTKQVAIIIVSLCFLLGIILRIQGMDLVSIFFFAVALSVSAIPEGLPVALTVVLSIAANRMVKRNVLVRRLAAVESLGSCTVIASDKTGTLTVNEQTAKIILLPDGNEYLVDGQGYNGDGQVYDKKGNKILFSDIFEIEKIAFVSAVANEGSLVKEDNSWIHHGDAIDVALLGMCYKLGMNPENLLEVQNINIIGKIPYESEHKLSAAFYELDGSFYVGVKGATEVVLNYCANMSINGEPKKIDKNRIISEMERLAKMGYRVLAFAGYKGETRQKKEEYNIADIPELTFYGVVGFIDPLRSEVKLSVEECRKAGIKVIMITGDHPETAGTIARELGIADQNTPVVTGWMLDQAGSYKNLRFEKLVLSTTVFARVSPAQKLGIVDVLIRNGEFVAVTGDGVNDAPALKRANIGVAMGSGTDVAKEVASMVIVDDNFSSIVAGVEEGRYAYDNVRKVIYLLVSTGAAEIFLFLVSVIARLPLPLLPVQLLWLNLVTNGIQHIGLAFEAGEPGAMKKPPRKPTEKIFNPLMVSQTIVSGVTMGLICFGFWLSLDNISHMSELHKRNLLLLLMVFFENLHVFNCRSETSSTFKIPLRKNIFLVFGVIIAQGVHILSMHIPVMQRVLKIEPITLNEWLNTILLAVPIILVMEIFKLIYNRRYTGQKGN